MSNKSRKELFEMEDRMEYWQDSWTKGDLLFHLDKAHPMLTKHFHKLFPNGGGGGRVFVPLCGKTVDMKWLVSQNLRVVGIDGVRTALEQFMSEQRIEYTSHICSRGGKDWEVLKSTGEKIQLYRGDMLDLTPDVAGTFDAVWDRASIVAIRREDVAPYVAVVKGLLKAGGRCLMETNDYDVSSMDETLDSSKPIPPPPYPMYEQELKELFGPDVDVELLDRAEKKLADRDTHTLIFLLTKS